MSTCALADSLVGLYPEKNPFDMTPPPDNLTPIPRDEEARRDSPAFCAEAAKQARRTGINPLYMWYGSNPPLVRDWDVRAKRLHFDKKTYTPPPTLPPMQFEEPLVYLECFHPTRNAYMFKVRIGEDLRLLKVFPDRDPDEEDNPENAGISMMCFRKEIEAYAHLRRNGADDKGVVPHCYGWFQLTKVDLDKIRKLPPSNDEDFDTDDMVVQKQPLHGTRRKPMGILLEYFDNAKQLTTDIITPALADKALRTLTIVHSTYVLHGDISADNILLLPDGRIVWIDFDESACPSEPNRKLRPGRYALFEELAGAWSYFYHHMLPNRRIGLHLPWTDTDD